MGMRRSEPGQARRPEHPPRLLRQVPDVDAPPQLLHPLPQAQQNGDARAVHKRHPRAVHHKLLGQQAVDLPLQLPNDPLHPMVVQLPGQGDGEGAVLDGVGNCHWSHSPFVRMMTN